MSRPLAGPRLERVLALVPWIATHPGTTIAELAARFEVDEAELEHDLELLPMCGLPPYTADRLIDLWVADDGAVSIRLAEYFERPLRLTPDEGVALLAAGRALLAVPGTDPDGPLATALDKLETVLGAPGAVAVSVGRSDHVGTLQAASQQHRQVEIKYYSFARDEMTQRIVDPWRVFHAFGAWYLSGYCHRADAERLFRIDRVRSVQVTDTPIAVPDTTDDDLAESVYQPDDTDVRVRLDLDPSAAWVADSYPVEAVHAGADGHIEIVLPVSASAFLERLLLGLGPAARVLDPPEARQLVAAAATRILARYDADAAAGS